MKKAFLFFLLLNVCFTLTAQDYSKEKIIPPNPIAASFKLYGDVPVSYNTGVPDITIPLYTIQIGDFSLPIELRYHIKALKPASCASNVALGWSLHYGGIVSRTVYGEPDGMTVVTYGTGIGTGSNIDLQDLYKDYQTDIKFKDTEYDIFNYNINGKYGEFIFDGNVQQMSKKPVSIKFEGYQNIDISDDHGNTFKFGYGKTEMTSTWDKSMDATTSWMLSQIALATNQQINFNYVDTTYSTTDYNEQLYLEDEFTAAQMAYDVPCLSSGPNVYNTPVQKKIKSLSLRAHYEKCIKEITFPNGKVEFILNPKDKRLITGVKVYQGSALIKSYGFNIPNSGGYMDYMRLLRNVTEKDGVSNKVNEYQFTYYNEAPVYKNQSTDYWGYNNNTVYTENSFPLGVYSNEAPELNISHTLIPGVHVIGNEDPVDFGKPSLSSVTLGLSKEANEISCEKNALKKIVYPTGGETEFEYELNECRYSDPNAIIKGDGLRIKKITNNPINGLSSTKTFLYEPQERFGDDFDIDNFVNTSYSVGIYRYLRYSSPSNYTPSQRLVRARIRSYNSFLSSRLSNYLKDIQYSKVTELIGTGPDNVGKNIYYFQYENSHENDYLRYRLLPYPSDFKSPDCYLLKYRSWDNGLLYKKESYKQNETEPLERSYFNYVYHYNPNTYKNTYIFKLTSYNLSSLCGILNEVESRNNSFNSVKLFWPSTYSNSDLDYMFPNVYGYINYEIEPGWLELESEERFEYIAGKTVNTTTSYLYNGSKTYYPSSIIKNRSDGSNDIQTVKYPYDFSTPPYTDMVSKNILYPVIESQKYKDTNFLESIRTNFKDWGNNIYKPTSIETKTGTNSYETRMTYDAFDSNANLLSLTNKNTIKESYIWGYNNTYPVVEIVGLAYADISSTIKTNITGKIFTSSSAYNDVKSDVEFLKNQLTTLISDSRYMVTYYTYAPLIGMTSKTDSRGVTTYYEYDAANRLKQTYIIENGEKKMLQKYDYHYANQQ